ncbi:MAG TPA: YbjN domain-containing protein [Gemmatimonadales bacterium]|nr:YbjN domain-containing protein [Gemmatimonadales bacterium]
MTTKEDIEAWLDRMELSVESLADDLWLLRTESGTELAVNFAPPLVVLRTQVLQLPSDPLRAGALCRMLLEFNARDLIHGSYGVEGDHVVLTDAHDLADLDFSEFEASVDSLTLALASHASSLAPYGEG